MISKESKIQISDYIWYEALIKTKPYINIYIWILWESTKGGRSTSRKARECNRDRRRPVLGGLGTFPLSAQLLSSPFRLPSLFLSLSSSVPLFQRERKVIPFHKTVYCLVFLVYCPVKVNRTKGPEISCLARFGIQNFNFRNIFPKFIIYLK